MKPSKKLIAALLAVTTFGCYRSTIPNPNYYLDIIGDEFYKNWQIRNAFVSYTDSSGRLPKMQAIALGCEADDIWRFYRNGNLVITDNADTCFANKKTPFAAKWIPDDTFRTLWFTAFRLGSERELEGVTFEVSNVSDTTLTLTTGATYPDTEKTVLNFRAF